VLGLPILELIRVTKRFGPLLANDAIDLSIMPGEIHAIVGENGAGKSTLMKTLAGVHTPDEGRIRFKGNEVDISTPERAMKLGIGMVYQHFTLVPSLTIAENVVLSNPPRRAGIFLKRRADQEVTRLGTLYGLPVEPKRKVSECRVGIQQRVEILKALYRDPDVLILDEPTAVLTPQEADALLRNLQGLKKKGKTIVFITHKLKEVMAFADRITVIRGGRVEATVDPAATSVSELAAKMVGRSVFLDFERRTVPKRERVLELDRVTWHSNRAFYAAGGVSLTLRRGEILGVAGVEGNGQSELIEVVAGLRAPDSGRVTINGIEVSTSSPALMRQLGLAHIPEDRIHQGLALEATLSENLIMGAHNRAPMAKGIWIDSSSAKRFSEELIEKFDIRPRAAAARAQALSGGNMQKVIIAREFASDPSLIIAANPTRGVDIGAADFAYQRLLELREKAGVLLISSDLDEIMRLSDRIVVMFQGRIMAELSPESVTGEKLGLLMAGIDPARAVPAKGS
jgi:general nucleoside transport system ATP-binding protein